MPMNSFRFGLLALVWCAGAVCAQSEAVPGSEESDRKPAHELVTEIAPMNIQPMRVTRHGPIEMPTWGERACNAIVSRTTASFSGGTYTLQGGLAQGEMVAVTYDVPAGDWPIKLDLAEIIWGTQNTIVATTTHWSILVYTGTPTNGGLVRTETSDGVILPHIAIPPGTNGVNLQFSVDPQDPDQIVINSFAGNPNKFTIAFRIDQHNQPGANPGCSAPQADRNAFPATDNTVIGCGSGYGQLAFPTQNWIFANNCAGGCAAGWTPFGSLISDQFIGPICVTGCRPRGDLVMRATYSSLSCTPGVGSCCLPDGNCNVLTQTDCATAGGTYNGDGTTCATANCGGACCLQNGNCIITSPNDCSAQSGTFQGLASTCETANCPQPTGACCLNNGAFCLTLSQTNCQGAGGVFQGANTLCGSGSTCPQGACCLPSGSCVIASPANCTTQQGTYRGNNTSCATANCPQPNGACCFSTGFCLVLSPTNCNNAGGTFLGSNTSCVNTNQCPNGKCCLPNGSCLVLSSDDCGGAGGTFEGAGTTCATSCGPTCNDIDINNDTSLFDPQDIDAFLSVYSEGPCVPDTATCDDIDFNNDGGLFDPCDIDAFLLVFAEGPCTLCGQ